MKQEALVHKFKGGVCVWCTVCVMHGVCGIRWVCVCVYVLGEEGDEGSCGQRGRKL